MAGITDTPEWKALAEHHHDMAGVHLRALFSDASARGEALAAQAAGIYLDYSKNRLTAETVRLLVALAQRAGLHERIDAMLAAQRINVDRGPAAAARRPAGAARRACRGNRHTRDI